MERAVREGRGKEWERGGMVCAVREGRGKEWEKGGLVCAVREGMYKEWGERGNELAPSNDQTRRYIHYNYLRVPVFILGS
jgi:hypothetical protein